MSIGNVSGLPKAVVGDLARDTTNRPPILKLKAPTFSGGGKSNSTTTKKNK